MGMNQSAMQETRVPSLGQEDTLEEGMATHSSIVVWRIPWTWSLVGYIPWGCKELDTTEQLTLSFSLSHTHRSMEDDYFMYSFLDNRFDNNN